MTSFASLSLSEPLQRALRDEGYTTPTPIQQQAIPPLLAGKDLLGCARTGTGKTAAFALPLLQRLFSNRRGAPRKSTRVLVVVPTRELATQVAKSFSDYGVHLRPNVAVIFGGVGQNPQVRAMFGGVDVLVATPGRLLDLMGQGHVRLDGVEALVLDEADQMLDLGFLPDIKKILNAVPRQRQNLLFSATMPKPIEELANRILHQPTKIFVTPVASTAELVEQRVYHVHKQDKLDLLEHVLRAPEVERVLVFTRTKRGCDKVAKRLTQRGIPAQAIHGNKSQSNREKALEGFRRGKLRVMVATDIAARGIDIDDITHVVNFELPNVPETYVHRIGRTARAGAAGIAISLCDGEERAYLRDIEKLIRRTIQVVGDAPVIERARQERPATSAPPAQHRPARQGGGHGGSHGGRGRHGGHGQRGGQQGGHRGGQHGGGGRSGGGHGGRSGRPHGPHASHGERGSGGDRRQSHAPARYPSRDTRPPARLEVRESAPKSEGKLATFGAGV
jgi:ATP-dependent RNA helicase RhlE